MTEETRQMELNNKIEDILVSYSKYSDYLRDDLRTLINQQIKAVLSEVKSRAEIVEYNSIDSELFKAVSVEAIEQIEERYK